MGGHHGHGPTGHHHPAWRRFQSVDGAVVGWRLRQAMRWRDRDAVRKPCGTVLTGRRARRQTRDPALSRDRPSGATWQRRVRCKPTTRLRDPARPAGYRIVAHESHGYYAATELVGTVDVLQSITGCCPPGCASISARSRRGRPVNKFAVPCSSAGHAHCRSDRDGWRAAAIPGRTDRRERVPRPALPPGPEPTSEPFVPRETRRALPPPHQPVSGPAPEGGGDSAPLPPSTPDEPPLPPEATAFCTAFSSTLGRCVREAHEGTNHRNRQGETWAP